MSLKDDIVVITGANSCLGQHLVKHLQLHWENLSKIRTFDTEDLYEKKLDFDFRVPVTAFCGKFDKDDKELQTALEGATTVIHLHEYKDFSLLPDTKKLWSENVGTTSLLLSMCHLVGVSRFIHLSSIFVMVSSVWPSVLNPEIAKLPPSNEMSYPDYCTSKLESERLVLNSGLQSFIIRLGLIFGEADADSLVITAMRAAKNNGDVIPVYGDRGGVMQFTYAGNVAWGIIHILRKMTRSLKSTQETVFLLDETPKVDIYSLMEPLVKERQIQISNYSTPFFLAYLPYCMMEKLVHLCENFFSVPEFVRKLPSSNFLYLNFYYWVFFSGSKARLYLDYLPLYSYKKAVQLSADYYAKCEL